MSNKEILSKILDFRDKRDWKQFHTPENLAKSISIEAGELLECFQWQSKNLKIDNIKEELADILNYCYLLANELDLDIDQIVLEKIKKNDEKYPVDKAKGSYKKYNEL